MASGSHRTDRSPKWLRALRFQRGDWLTIVVCAASLAVAWWILYELHDSSVDLYVNPDIFPTLLEVIPAVIVAVAVFAAGTIFVIAQLISAALGSRAVLALLTDGIARSGVIAGMLLLLASLAVATIANVPGQNESGRLSPGVSSFAFALAVSTGMYVLWTMLILVVVVWRFVDPSSYSTDLARVHARVTSRRTVEELYRRIRALRQWLRTAAAAGESRDLVFALVGLEGLLLSYQGPVIGGRLKGRWQTSQSLVPAEYGISRGMDDDGRCAGILEQRPRKDLHLPGWFGAELGRALVRGLEVGMRAQLLRRDANRILKTLNACIRLSAVELGDDGRRTQLPEDAGYLIDRLAEAGLLSLQIDAKEPWRGWPEDVASRLAELEGEFESEPHFEHLRTWQPTLDAQPRPRNAAPRPRTWSLAARALVHWCAVQKALHVDPPQVDLAPLGPLASGRNRELWEQARALARVGSISPAWLPGQKAPAGSTSSTPEPNSLEQYVLDVYEWDQRPAAPFVDRSEQPRRARGTAQPARSRVRVTAVPQQRPRPSERQPHRQGQQQRQHQQAHQSLRHEDPERSDRGDDIVK